MQGGRPANLRLRPSNFASYEFIKSSCWTKRSVFPPFRSFISLRVHCEIVRGLVACRRSRTRARPSTNSLLYLRVKYSKVAAYWLIRSSELKGIPTKSTAVICPALFRAPAWSVWSLDFREGRKPRLRVLKCDKSACADFDGAKAPEADFVPGCRATDACPSGESIDRHRAATQGGIGTRHTKLHVVFPG